MGPTALRDPHSSTCAVTGHDGVRRRKGRPFLRHGGAPFTGHLAALASILTVGSVFGTQAPTALGAPPPTSVGAQSPTAFGAQAPTVNISHYTVAEGLAVNWITSLAQDAAGFLWVGTRRGLQRYDGYEFVPFAELGGAAPPALAGPISRLHVDTVGHLWIVAGRSVFRRNARDGSLQHAELAVDPWASVADSAGLWVSAAGMLIRIEVTQAGLRARDTLHSSLFSGCTSSALAPHGELLFMCSPGGVMHLLRVEPSTGRVVAHRAEGTGPVHADAKGRIWIAAPWGLAWIDSKTGELHEITATKAAHVRALASGDEGRLLILAETASGLVLWELDSDGTLAVRARLAPDHLYPTTLMFDRERAAWIGTSAAGLFRIAPDAGFESRSSVSASALPFGSDFITGLHECADERLWVTTLRGGAYLLSRARQLEQAVRYSPVHSVERDEMWGVVEDDTGAHWFATRVGLCVLERDGLRCHRPPADDAGVFQIVRDRSGWLWLASSSGVYSFEPAARRFHEALDLIATALHVDDDGHLWVAAAGVWRAPVRNGRVTGPAEFMGAPSSAHDLIYAFHRDRAGKLFVGSAGGLQLWHSERRMLEQISLPALAGITVFSMTEDLEGRLWLGTSHGLALYSPETGRVRRFRRLDDRGNVEFNRRAALRLSGGDLVFGGTQGLTFVRPSLVTAVREPPPVVFVGWSAARARGPAREPLDGVSELELHTTDRGITIQYAALTFAHGAVAQYRYRLEGIDPDWIETSSRSLSYGSLPKGRFILRVQAATGDGVWHEPGAQLRLHVHPAFWQTAWFGTLAAVLLLAGTWALHRLRLQRVVATERLRLRISRDLHDEIGAGLSSIALLSDRVSRHAAMGGTERATIERIGQSARRMVGDLRDIVWAIDPEADRWKDVVARMRDVADGLLPGVRIRFNAPPGDELAGSVRMSSRRDLLLIYNELLHNIARHAGASAVEIWFHIDRDRVELIVEDDGRGFDADRVRNGTGLRSMQERAERLNGRLDFTRREAGGIRSRLLLPRT